MFLWFVNEHDHTIHIPHAIHTTPVTHDTGSTHATRHAFVCVARLVCGDYNTCLMPSKEQTFFAPSPLPCCFYSYLVIFHSKMSRSSALVT